MENLSCGNKKRVHYNRNYIITEYVITGAISIRVCMNLLPGPAIRVRYIRRYVIAEYVITRLYCNQKEYGKWCHGYYITLPVLTAQALINDTIGEEID